MKSIFVKTINGEEEVFVTRNPDKDLSGKKGLVWYTQDNQSEVGEDVVIENNVGSRVKVRRIK